MHMENTIEQHVPKGWTADVWQKFNKKMEEMSKEELIKTFHDLGLDFQEPEEKLTKDSIIAVADELSEEDVKAYFKM